MADEKPHSGAQPGDAKPKFDPFKAEDPVLPGVPSKAAGAAPATAGFALDFKDPKILAGGGIALVVIFLVAWMMFGSSEKSAEPAPSAATPAPATSPAPAASGEASPQTAAAPPVVQLPGVAGTPEEFPQPWSTKKIFVQKVTGRTPALIIRLPGGNPRRAEGYWGLLLVSPYGRCELEYVEDLKRLADDFGYRARHPMVVDPCNLTVFDPTRLGDIGGIVARGAVVQGTTLRPPLSMELKIENGRIMVLQTE